MSASGALHGTNESEKEMKQKVILHIPHASTAIPESEGFVVNDDFLKKEILKLTDWYTDDLFHSDRDEMIAATFSRIFCDPERFPDDAQEVMAAQGMGVLYEKSDCGQVIRNVAPELRERVLERYYAIHNRRLSEAVKSQLNIFGKAIIIDCHSFPSRPLNRDLDKTMPRPAFNIGTDPVHTPKYLEEAAVSFFTERGYDVGVNWPYSGSLVPMEYYGIEPNVQSIMLEINRSLYMDEPTGTRSEGYAGIKQVTGAFIGMIGNLLRG